MDELTTTDLKQASLSPSFAGVTPAAGSAYEIKFVLSEEQAREVEERLLRALLPDPHSDPALGGMYSIESLACDDPGFGAFYREERVKNRKYRVRRYGLGGALFLERKRSRRGKVRKRRVEASLADLEELASGKEGVAAHSWFAREVALRQLAPVCRVRYMRRALFGACEEGPMRVTMDRAIRGALARGWSLDYEGEERSLLVGVVVCEFKFRGAMPSPLKTVMADMRLEARGVSKYRTCVRTFASELGVNVVDADLSGADRA